MAFQLVLLNSIIGTILFNKQLHVSQYKYKFQLLHIITFETLVLSSKGHKHIKTFAMVCV